LIIAAEALESAQPDDEFRTSAHQGKLMRVEARRFPEIFCEPRADGPRFAFLAGRQARFSQSAGCQAKLGAASAGRLPNSRILGSPGRLEVEATGKPTVGLFVDRSSPDYWVVRDPEGNFWMVPPAPSPWESRQPFSPSETAALEPVPGHYKYLLELPF
jgi:hypothetical protein